MEALKELEKIMQPDNRQKAFIARDRQTGEQRALTLHDFHDDAASIKLHEGVPEKIRDHFATAQNLIIYSWFFYPFNVTAQFMGFVSLEFALKEKLQLKKNKSFRYLIQMAVEKGLVNDEGFSHVQNKQHFEVHENVDVVPQQTKKYVEILVDSFPDLRNLLAHGSSMLYGHGASSVRICAEFINQLYPIPT